MVWRVRPPDGMEGEARPPDGMEGEASRWYGG